MVSRHYFSYLLQSLKSRFACLKMAKFFCHIKQSTRTTSRDTSLTFTAHFFLSFRAVSLTPPVDTSTYDSTAPQQAVKLILGPRFDFAWYFVYVPYVKSEQHLKPPFPLLALTFHCSTMATPSSISVFYKYFLMAWWGTPHTLAWVLAFLFRLVSTLRSRAGSYHKTIHKNQI